MSAGDGKSENTLHKSIHCFAVRTLRTANIAPTTIREFMSGKKGNDEEKFVFMPISLLYTMFHSSVTYISFAMSIPPHSSPILLPLASLIPQSEEEVASTFSVPAAPTTRQV